MIRPGFPLNGAAVPPDPEVAQAQARKARP